MKISGDGLGLLCLLLPKVGFMLDKELVRTAEMTEWRETVREGLRNIGDGYGGYLGDPKNYIKERPETAPANHFFTHFILHT